MTQPPPPLLKVLVIDDEPAICRIVTHTLKRRGFDASSTSRADEVLGIIKDNSFDFVLLDRSMGTTEGSELLPLIRHHAPSAKVLYFTGECVEPKERQDVDGVVQKPIDGIQLSEALHRLS